MSAILALSSAQPASARSARVTVRAMADGAELITAYDPGASEASLRLVFRGGAALDGVDHDGLAHLLEHVVFQGNRDVEEHAIQDMARHSGGELNGLTASEYTCYTLDAPAGAFPALAAAFIRMVTNPRLEWVDLTRERGVITTEDVWYTSLSVHDIVDDFLFPSASKGQWIIGSSSSRARIRKSHLQRYYLEHYLTSNLTVIMTGAVKPDAARALYEENSRLPPTPERDASLTQRDRPNVPLQTKALAPVGLSVFGYVVNDAKEQRCDELARLLHLRLVVRLDAERPLASATTVDCTRIRDQLFLLAVAQNPTSEVAQLPDEMEQVFQSAITDSPTREEIQTLRARARHDRWWLHQSPRRLADRLVELAGNRPRSAPRTDVSLIRYTPAWNAAELKRLADRNFTPQRRISIHFSPLEMD